MKNEEKRLLFAGTALIAAFVMWTILVQTLDVQPAGQNGTDIGFASLNLWFHQLTGAHLELYMITDWMGLVPVAVCMFFCAVGMSQLVKRRSLFKVDHDIIFLGIYYAVVITAYLIFEMFPVNYRPVLIDGILEASYPSSTTLLVLSVMSSLVFQAGRRIRNAAAVRTVSISAIIFTAFMIIGRLISGVHWLTDIAGAIILSTGLSAVYKAVVVMYDKRIRRQTHGIS